MRLVVPGSDILAEGWFMTTNKSSDNEKAKEHFRRQLERPTCTTMMWCGIRSTTELGTMICPRLESRSIVLNYTNIVGVTHKLIGCALARSLLVRVAAGEGNNI